MLELEGVMSPVEQPAEDVKIILDRSGLHENQERLRKEKEKYTSSEKRIREEQIEKRLEADKKKITRRDQLLLLIKEVLNLNSPLEAEALKFEDLNTKFMVLSACSIRFDRIIHNFDLNRIKDVKELCDFFDQPDHVFVHPLFPDIDLSNLPKNLFIENYEMKDYRKKQVI
jgi:hypothetical protein